MLVTGAAQGIGRRVAERVLEEGALLVAVDRSELVHELQHEHALTLTADLEQYAECAQVMAATKARFGRIDILINNVGGTIWAKPFEHYAEHEIEAEVRRSLFPTLWCCHSVLPYMLEQGSGAIVNVSSIATRSINRVPYGAAKGGVNALTACLALETAGSGIGSTPRPPAAPKHRRAAFLVTVSRKASRSGSGTSKSSIRPSTAAR